MHASRSTPSLAHATRHAAARRLTPPADATDAWLRDWHASRAVRRRDDRRRRSFEQAARLSMWIGPVISGIVIYMTVRETLISLLDRLVLP